MKQKLISIFTLCLVCVGLFSPVQSFADTAKLSDNYVLLSSEGEVIFNGKNLGNGSNLVTSDTHFAFEQMQDDGVHIIFDGKDMGIGKSPQITEGKLLYETEKDLQNTVVFDGVNYGAGEAPLAKDGHFIYFQTVRANQLRNVYQGTILAYYDGKYYCDGKDTKLVEKINIAGNNVICEQEVSKNGTSKSFIVLNGKVIDEGRLGKVSKKHYGYTKKKDYGDGKPVDVIIVDGKDLGEGTDLQFSEDNFIFFKKNVSGSDEIVFNGMNLGGFKSKDSIIFKDGHLVFLRDQTEIQRDPTTNISTSITVSHAIYDGIDKGAVDAAKNDGTDSKKIFISGSHIAFERTLKGVDFDLTSGKQVTKDVTYAVVDGKERTAIDDGTLRMKDGVFAFSKESETYDAEAPTDEDKKDADGNTLKDSSGNTIKVKGKYIKKNFIYKGEASSNTVKLLGDGIANTIIVSGGRVAYTKKISEQQNFYLQGSSVPKTVEVSHVFVNGVDSGAGDITTVVMDKGQYSFAENVNGRYFLIINGKRSAYTGKNVLFLGEKENTTPTLSSTTSNTEIFSGSVIKRAGRYFMNTKNKTIIELIPKGSLTLESFVGKTIYVSGNKITSTSTGKAFDKYNINAASLTPISALSASETLSIKGVLQYKEGGYFLKGDNASYALNFVGVSVQEARGYVGDSISIKAKKTSTGYDVYSIE